MEQDNIIVVIGRTYGSGGRRIGRLIADRLNIPYYDKSLLKKAAEKLGYSPDIFVNKDEKRPSLLRSLLSFNYGAPTANINETAMSDEKLYEFQSRVIKEITNKESCVIVGRTADYILRDYPGMISIFIHSPLEIRCQHIIDRGEVSDLNEAKAIANKIDHQRESYYNYYTNRHWGHCDNYHISIDSSKVTDDIILDMVKNIIDKNKLRNC